jgi:hypothetical protein
MLFRRKLKNLKKEMDKAIKKLLEVYFNLNKKK